MREKERDGLMKRGKIYKWSKTKAERAIKIGRNLSLG